MPRENQPPATPIRILEKENNRRGDLFARLMTDLFIALGYDVPRLNVHKSGREVDLEAEHRQEPRRAIAECKATDKPTGGHDLNKFAGVVDAERWKKTLTGYFVSLAGFTEPALEQEKQRRRKTVLLTAADALDELTKGSRLISRERAADLAGRLCAPYPSLQLATEMELLAHTRGWIWAVYYSQGRAQTHFALIHADGTPLATAIVDEVVAADRKCGGTLFDLTSLNPAPAMHMSGADESAALASYRRYLESECGFIQLDGLPADGDVGSRRLRLESLFVPLHLDVKSEGRKTWERASVGEVIREYKRLALLAAPGGGKSTLIKRLAVAYSDPQRRKQIADGLPDENWLPLFFRCRELRELARGSFADLLKALAHREPVRQHAEAFRALVDRELLAGRVLLLIDGLDELSGAGDRAAFVCTLRTTLEAYPQVALVVTSREAGFRHVAAHLESVCSRATLAPLTSEDIGRLTGAWYREVAGDSGRIRTEADELAATIVRNDRIRRLAVNPLLLTALLLVKRWVGALPTRRAVLYGKAVEVLLRTWNTEGHDPIPEEEAMPQLCYVASAMLLSGDQKISRPRLVKLLKAARITLPMELGYVQETVDQFLHRVEDRSSLLMMSGHDVEDGQLVEFFEFRHLTFQEFLTAKAMVEGWHPGREDDDTLGSVLTPYFAEEAWREVIPLSAVLGGKATDELIRRLTQADADGERGAFDLLGNCLADEAAARPETVRAAIRQVVRHGSLFPNSNFVAPLARSKYGAELYKEVADAFLSRRLTLDDAATALAEILWWQNLAEKLDRARNLAWCLERLRQPETLSRCEGALAVVMLLRHEASEEGANDQSFTGLGEALLPLLFSTSLPEQFAAAWAYVWLGRCGSFEPPVAPDLLGRLFQLSVHSPDCELRNFSAWALSNQRLAARDEGRCSSVASHEVRKALAKSPGWTYEKQVAALITAWYLRALEESDIVLLSTDLGQPNGGKCNGLAELMSKLTGEIDL